MDPRPDHGETSYKGSGRLLGRKALITGGDSGMGRAAAIAYAREGADVAINYFPTEEPDAREVIELIQKEGRTGLAIPGDLRDEKFCQELVERAVKGLGGLDIVVSNAGRQQTRASILDITTEDFDATMKTNIYAPFWIIKAALPHLKPGSVIIGTASEQAYDPSPDLYDYAQTKAATMNYVKSLAKQLAPKGIRVNAVAPGPIWTPLQVSGGATQEKLEKFGGQTPIGPGRSAGRTRLDIRSARCSRRQFCHRSGLRLRRRLRPALTAGGRESEPCPIHIITFWPMRAKRSSGRAGYRKDARRQNSAWRRGFITCWQRKLATPPTFITCTISERHAKPKTAWASSQAPAIAGASHGEPIGRPDQSTRL